MLSNIKVLELASVLAGPDVGMFFAELGAKVIKIENKNLGGDVTRQWKSPNESKTANVSAYFSSVNWNKEYLFLNLKESKDREKIYELTKEADIIIANFKSGDAVKLGMDYLTLKKYKNDIIYGEINGYGSNNNRAAYDVVLQAETGFMSINGTPESGPIKMPVALIDVLAAHQLKEGLLLALLKKEKTNSGSFVEVSLYDSAVSSLKNQATNWLMNNFIPKPMGSLHPNIAPYGETYKTKDNKLLVLAIGNNKHFNMLLIVINAEHLIDDGRYANNHLRVINRASLNSDLKPFFALQTKQELMNQFLSLNIPVGAINDISEVFENKNAKQLILEEEIDSIKTKRVKTVVFKIS
jgi:crotonobetainyl-CoA:carnitine CoA-transferase CaiB-like acyl-CoA transferase